MVTPSSVARSEMAARTTNEISSETPVTHRMKISVIAEQEMYNKNQFFEY